MPLAAMLRSIDINLKKYLKVKVFILHKQVSTKDQSCLNRAFKKSKLVIEWVAVNDRDLISLKIDGHISVQTYYRLLIEHLFSEYTKLIYLDADLVVNNCIAELWDMEMNEKYLLAVPMASPKSGLAGGERGLPAYKLLGISADTRTFNAGVMVLNLLLWRKDSISQKIIKYLTDYRDYVLWWDQDGLNCVLYNGWGQLPAKWNVMTCHVDSFNTWRDSLLTERDFIETLKFPAIIHFAGPAKPWNANYKGSFKDYFIKYLKLLPPDIISKLATE